MRLAAAAIVVAALSTPAVAGEEDFGGGSVLFAREQGLWQTDAKGKGPAVERVRLPGNATEVRMVRSNPDGSRVLFDAGGVWWWAAIDLTATTPATSKQLSCAAGAARFTPDGTCVLCADPDGNLLLIGLDTGKQQTRPVPATGARVLTGDAGREILWAGADGVWASPIMDLTAKRELAPEAPVRGFLAAPDGKRAVATYPGEVYEKKQRVPAEVFDTFALDGKASRRMLYNKDAYVLDWSWDSVWLLVQDGASACITRAVGGEYKCWKGYTAVSIAPDGRYALMLGPRKGGNSDGDEADDDDAGGDGGSDEASDDDEADEEDVAPVVAPGGEITMPTGKLSLFRGKLNGPYAGRPSLVETVVDGAALWLPGVPAVDDGR